MWYWHLRVTLHIIDTDVRSHRSSTNASAQSFNSQRSKKHSTVKNPDLETGIEFLASSAFDLRTSGKYYVSGDPTYFQRCRMYCRKLSESGKVSNAIMFVIIINTTCMAIEHHNQVSLMLKVSRKKRLATPPQPIKGQCYYHIKTSQLICIANYLTGFWAMARYFLAGFFANIFNFSILR